jgi:hypothetical protein
MKSQTTQTATIIAIVAVAAGLAGYAAATQGPSIIHAFAASTLSTSQTTTSTNGTNLVCNNMNGGHPDMIGSPMGQFGPPRFQSQNQVSIATGTSIAITSTSGEFRVFGSPTTNGTANATMTFSVSSQLSRGYVLTLTGGTITINGTAYTVSSGTAQMNRAANAISGQGTTSSNGAFEVQARAYGDFTGTTTAQIALDIKIGSTDYAILLSGTIQG